MPRNPEHRRVTVSADGPGPLLMEGPVDVVLEDGTVVSSERFTVAICTCHRSGSYPWCDTSHRLRARVVRNDDGRPTRAGPGTA
ncbi:CDGSH iron-sulfur domain-containing protein [Streptomyces sp. NPDC050804]|uniref:CDGSH iron-sulfur domain-containing protein n=1 Tax=Streptomyces sp. NPDC050804 TaxID=3154745 RepID=UPI00342CC2F5